jgi:hypothetical protein
MIFTQQYAHIRRELLEMCDALKKMHEKWRISFATEEVSQRLKEFHQHINEALNDYTVRFYARRTNILYIYREAGSIWNAINANTTQQH